MTEMNHWSMQFIFTFIIGSIVFWFVYDITPIVFYLLAFVFIFAIGLPYGWRFKKIKPAFILGVDGAIIVVFILRIFQIY